MPFTPPSTVSDDLRKDWQIIIQELHATSVVNSTRPLGASALFDAEKSQSSPSSASSSYLSSATDWLFTTLSFGKKITQVTQDTPTTSQSTSSAQTESDDWLVVTAKKVNEIENEFVITTEQLETEKKNLRREKRKLQAVKSSTTQADVILALEQALAKQQKELELHKAERDRYLNERIEVAKKLVEKTEEINRLKEEKIHTDEKLQQLETEVSRLRSEEKANENKLHKKNKALEHLDLKLATYQQSVIDAREETKKTNLEVKRLQDEITEQKRQQEQASREIKSSEEIKRKEHTPIIKNKPHLVIDMGQQISEPSTSPSRPIFSNNITLPRAKKSRKWPWYITSILSLGGAGVGAAIGLGFIVVLSGPIGWGIFAGSLLLLTLSVCLIRNAKKKDKLVAKEFHAAFSQIILSPIADSESPTHKAQSQLTHHAKISDKSLLSSRSGAKKPLSDELDEQEETPLIEIAELKNNNPQGSEKKSGESATDLIKKLAELQKTATEQQAELERLEKESKKIEDNKFAVENEKDKLEKQKQALANRETELSQLKKQLEEEREQLAKTRTFNPTPSNLTDNSIQLTANLNVPMAPPLLLPASTTHSSAPEAPPLNLPVPTTAAASSTAEPNSFSKKSATGMSSTLLTAIQAGFSLQNINKTNDKENNSDDKSITSAPVGSLLASILTTKLRKSAPTTNNNVQKLITDPVQLSMLSLAEVLKNKLLYMQAHIQVEEEEKDNENSNDWSP